MREAGGRRDAAALAAMARTVSLRSDIYAEKVMSRRHRFLYICVPKVASRSLIDALSRAAPDSRVIHDRTLAQIAAAYPEVRDYYCFAFLRNPLHRAFSFYSYIVRVNRQACRKALDFMENYHGMHPEMTFGEFCRWLSQYRHMQFPDGRKPDFIGRYECLDADWQRVMERLGLQLVPLARWGDGNSGSMVVDEHLEDSVAELLKRRYAEDFQLGGYDI